MMISVCETCGQKSDSTRHLGDRTLCVVCWDTWIESPERATDTAWPVTSRFVSFVERVKEEHQSGLRPKEKR